MTSNHTAPAHTLGPWHVERTRHNGAPVTFITNEAGRRLAEVVHALTFVTDNDEEQANAHLIAASPTLLGELRVANLFLRAVPREVIESIEAYYDMALNL